MPTETNEKIPFMTDRDLRLSGRDIDVPFRISLNCSDVGRSEVICTEILRLLPGKRLVCAGKWEGRHIVVKIFLDSVRGKYHFYRERRGYVALSEAGIKVPPVLFSGTVFSGKSPAIGFLRLTDAHDFSEVWKDTKDDNQRVRILCRIVLLIADQHRAGLKQDDPHLANFLVDNDEIYSIDNDTVDTGHKGVPLSRHASIKNLGLFFAQFDPEFDPIIKTAFGLYAKIRLWPEVSRSLLMKEVNRYRKKRLDAYLKKIFRMCTAFECKKNFTRYQVCSRQYCESMQGLFDDPDGKIDKGRFLKRGNSSTVVLLEEGEKTFVVKRYNIKGLWHGVKRAVTPSRARRSWKNAHMLMSMNISTPRPVALIEKRFGPFRFTAYLVTEFVDGVDAHNLFYSNMIRYPDDSCIVDRFSHLFRSFADKGIVHGDLKATNFIVRRDSLFITDLDSMKVCRSRWFFHRAFKRDIGRFMENWTGLDKWKKLFEKRLMSDSIIRSFL